MFAGSVAAQLDMNVVLIWHENEKTNPLSSCHKPCQELITQGRCAVTNKAVGHRIRLVGAGGSAEESGQVRSGRIDAPASIKAEEDDGVQRIS
jgi:hypothetical protein